MRILELFCGTKSISNEFKDRGHEVFTIDINPAFEPDQVRNILEVNIKDIPFKPDIIWASPPCTTFSIANCKSNNYTDFVPNNVNACLGLAYVYKAIELIKELNPKFWFIENPRGYLRKFPFMYKYHRNTVTYCQYGDKRQKPTDIWTNNTFWVPKKMCKPKSSCHEPSPRGTHDTGTQGLKDDLERSRIPRLLALEICLSCEKGLNKESNGLEKWQTNEN